MLPQSLHELSIAGLWKKSTKYTQEDIVFLECALYPRPEGRSFTARWIKYVKEKGCLYLFSVLKTGKYKLLQLMWDHIYNFS